MEWHRWLLVAFIIMIVWACIDEFIHPMEWMDDCEKQQLIVERAKVLQGGGKLSRW